MTTHVCRFAPCLLTSFAESVRGLLCAIQLLISTCDGHSSRSFFDAEYDVLYFAHIPGIRDPDFQQNGLNIVVAYDLIGEEGEEYDVQLLCSSSDDEVFDHESSRRAQERPTGTETIVYGG